MTDQQKYIELLKKYNEALSQEIGARTIYNLLVYMKNITRADQIIEQYTKESLALKKAIEEYENQNS